jgi:hypothetical protein
MVPREAYDPPPVLAMATRIGDGPGPPTVSPKLTDRGERVRRAVPTTKVTEICPEPPSLETVIVAV